MSTIISTACIFNSTISSTANAREWWAVESRRCGTDWRSLIDCAQAVLSELRVIHVGASSS
jgi:hypothetical protein